MATHFKILRLGPRRWLSVRGPWEPRLADVMRAHELTDLRLYAADGAAARIDFLRDIPFLEVLGLCVVGLRDVTPLYDSPNLRALTLQGVEKAIDFTRIPRLTSLSVQWSTRFFASLLDCEALTDLGIDYFSDDNFRPFARLTALQNIGFGFTRVDSLDGVERFPLLRRLSLGPINRLETLDHLEGCPHVSSLQIEAAKKLRRIDAVSSLRAVQELCFTRCPAIQSLQPVAGLPELEYVSLLLTTTIAEGDISALHTLPRLKHASIADRKHYNVKNTDLPKAYRQTHKLTTLYQE
jgi:hypothetical protein